MKESSHPLRFILLKLVACICFLIPPPLSSSHEGPWYDSSAYTECKEYAEPPLYGGGILRDLDQQILANDGDSTVAVYSPAYVLQNLTQNTNYALSCWIKIEGADSALVRAKFSTNNSRVECVGSALAKTGCWSFLKGGFAPDSSSATFGVLFFQSSGEKAIKISVASASLQPFTDQQWRMHQDGNIKTKRKRTVNIHVSDTNGQRQQGATVTVEQIYRDFPFGSAIAKTILDNSPYQQLKFGTHRDFSTSCNGRALVPLFYKSTGQELFQSCVVRSTFPIRLLTTMAATEKPVVEDSPSVTLDTPQHIKFKRPDKTARHIMQILNKEAVEAVKAEREIPDIKPGYIVQLKVEVPENKRRVSIVKGIVIARRNAGLNTTFRLRRLVAGVGVESVFPLYSPNIKEFKVLDKKKVRRAKLYYLRDRMDAFRK